MQLLDRRWAWRAGTLTFLGCAAFAGVARWLNANIGFGNAINCDGWYFFGLQFNFREMHHTGQFYQTFRFPALIPWIFLGTRLPYEALNALKFFTYFAMTCAGCFWFSTRLYGPRVAALVTVLFCCSTGFLGVLSHDFVTAAGVGWISFLVGATVESGRSRFPLRWGFVAGVLFGMCVYTHIPIVFFIFAVPLLYFAVPAQRAPIHGFVRYAGGSVVGFCIVSVLCGFYNWSLGGSWFFLGPEIRHALGMVKDASLSAPDRGVGFEWLTREATVVSMELGILASIAALILYPRAANDRITKVAAVVYLLTAAVSMGWEISGRILLQVNVFAPWIYPSLLLAFGAALSRLKVIEEMSSRALIGTLLVAACVLLVAARTDVSTVPADRLLSLKMLFGATFVTSLIALHRWRIGLVAVLALALFMAVNYPTGYGSFPWATYNMRGRDMAFQAMQAHRKIDELDLDGIPVFWIKASRPETTAIPRSYFYCGGFGASFPSLTPREGFEAPFPAVTSETIGSARTLVVIAPGENLAALAAPRLREIGFDSTSLGEWPIGSGELANTLSVLRIARSGNAVPTGATAAFVRTDTTTQGNWRSRYGRGGYTVAGDATGFPSDAQVAVVGGTPYTWQAETSDNRALQHVTGAGRLASAWYAFGSLSFDINLSDGAPHQIALYGVDWDDMARHERVEVRDAVTGTVLDAQKLSSFTAGQYLVWTVRGHVSLVVTRTAGVNAVVSGLFIDPVVADSGGSSAK